MFRQTIQAAILALAVGAAMPVQAAMPGSGPERANGAAVMIPPAAMAEMLRCRHIQRPEEECFAVLRGAVERDRHYAQNMN
jgi:hypothetical protein